MSDTALEPRTVTRYHLPFDTDGGIASRAAIGVIVLASDYTLEHEFRALLDIPGVAFYESRIRNDPRITPETLKAMEGRIAEAADVILPGTDLDVVAFGCTSASMVIGEDGVFAKIRSVRPDAACTTPITAAFAAFEALEAKRIAVLTPYRDDVNQVVRSYIESRGYQVAVMGSFNEESDPVVARIAPASLAAAIEEIAGLAAIDAVFVSCTSLRLADAARDIEARIGKPVTSSNHALAWHCLRLAGVDDKRPEYGRLFTV
jgi:maleate isomerase